jgi:metallophosphoesterase (TIGR03767 family)
LSAGRPPLTTHRRLAPGTVLRRGATAPYRAVEIIAGEPHMVRDDLAAAPDPAAAPPGRRPLLCLIHVTDLQLADVQSPTRFEFLNRYFGDPRYAALVPVQRPQEALTPHAVEATLRTVNALRGPATGQPPALAVTTGDAIDNAQWNEVQAFLALFDGGQVTPGSGGPGYHGIQALDWPDDIFWKPDGEGPDGPDFFRRELGFPHHPGLLEAAMREFTAGGLDMPWLSCFGNHEALNQGVGTQTPGLAAALTGDRKPVGRPGGYDADEALELFTVRPEAFMAGPSRQVPADPGRRPVTRREFVAAHFRPGAYPPGHGFTDGNLRDGTAYYAHDTPAARFIALDTNCLAGGADGCLDRQQARWLEARLAEVHSAYRGPGGEEIRTGQDDRLVILFSHHGLDTLTNSRGWHPGPGGEPLIGAAELTALLHRFPNVVLWLNGHTHVNAVRPRPDPDQPGRGFWEVTTCAVVDWPCQTRLVELADSGGQLSITCTMVDHDTPLGPPPSQAGPGGATTALFSTGDLAALHRELAANIPSVGGTGSAADRNVELLISPPFPVDRLPGA